MPPLGQVVHIRVSKCSARSSTQNPPENPRGARPRALCVAVCVCVWVSLSRATLTRGRIGVRVHSIRGRFEANTKTRDSVWCLYTNKERCIQWLGFGPHTGCLSRAHGACAPKPTRMAVGLTRDGREALRREVQGISQSSTRRSAYSKRHVGAPNRRTKQVKLLVDHRCRG